MKTLKDIFKDFILFYEKQKSYIHSIFLLSFVLIAIILFVHQSVQLNKNEIWFSNMDLDATILVESLMVNSGKEPQFTDNPGFGTYILYGKCLRLFEVLNIIHASEFNQLEASNDPLMLLPDLFYKGRSISIIIAILCALSFGFIFYLITRKLLSFLVSTILFLFSGGLLFQSLILRSELTSVFFVLLSILFLIIHSKIKKPSFLTVITAGVLFGFAVLAKIQALLIFMFMIILLLYIVFKQLKKSPEGLLKYRIIHFFITIIIISIYMYFLNLIYHVYTTYGSIPVLLKIFISVIIISTIISTLIWVKQKRISSLLNHINQFSIGFLISFLAVFYLSNITTDNFMRYTFNLVFQSGGQRQLISELLHSTGSFASIFDGFARFLKYYLLESYLMIFILLFFLLTIKRIDYRATITFIFGVGYCLFSSLRHFGPHYLIYSDIFLNATLVLLMLRFLAPLSKDSKYKALFIKSSMRFTVIILILFLLGQSQLNFVKKSYQEYGEGSRNRIEEIPFSHDRNNEYSEMMKKKYRNAVNIIQRVYNDPYLNGSEDGIDITKKVNYGLYGWLALPEVRDINLRVSSQDLFNREMLNLLKNIYQDDKDKFDEIKDRTLKKQLGWSDEDVERRIIREIPSYLVNLKMFNKIEFVGYDIVPVIPYKSEDKVKNELTKNVHTLFQGEEFELISYWKCLEEMNFRYSIWVTLDKGFDSAKLEHQLVYVFGYTTHKWRPGETIKEIRQLRVPKYYDPGVYEVKMSLTKLNEKKEISPFTNVGKVKILMPKKTQ